MAVLNDDPYHTIRNIFIAKMYEAGYSNMITNALLFAYGNRLLDAVVATANALPTITTPTVREPSNDSAGPGQSP